MPEPLTGADAHGAPLSPAIMRRRDPAAVLALALLALLGGLAATAPLGAQAPHEAWRTLELPHFRVHYPAASEAWARRVASRLEAIRERLEAEVGYAPPQVVEVVVADPLSLPNGSAWPFLGRPRMVLWTSPPEPSSVLGRYRDWGELVAVHEEAHLVHLLRPARNPWQRLIGRLVPAGGLGPIPRRAPRWATEGYATLLEGRLTGSGRPSSDLRAAVLRQRARAGRLPSYGALGSGDESWLGRSMAYLVGSAYLRWLEDRATGPEGEPREGALRDVWARMTARRDRSFEDAFRGVFGEGPAELYGRFTAELTWRALEAERRLGGPQAHEGSGELWLDLSWGTGAPAVSPDGERLAAVVRGREVPARLTVWETAPDPEAEARREEDRRELLERDPEDVPAVQVGPPPREPVATLPTFDGREPLDPRWSRDGESLLFAALGPDRDGFLRADLYRWVLERGEVERLTHLADLRSPDPLPGTRPGKGPRAVAVRNRHGLSQLVVVDLETGAVRPLSEPSVEEVWATPRVSPDGGRLAAVRLREGTWRLVVAELEEDDQGTAGLATVRELPTPEGATVADPAWGPDGRTLYASVGTGGFLDLWAFDLDGGAGEAEGRRQTRQLTRTLGAALAPAPTPDGKALFYLALEHDGLDIQRLELGRRATGPPYDAPRTELPAELAPAILRPAEEAEVEPFAEAVLPEDRPYGPGPQEVTPLVGLALAPSGLALEAGVRGGDVVGRLDWLLLGSLGHAGAVEGGVLAAAWRGLPVELTGALFATSEEPSDQDSAPPGGRRFLDVDRTGLALAAGWDRRFPGGAAAARLGLLAAEVGSLGPGSGEGIETGAATLRAGLAWAPSRGRWSLPLELAGALQEGETDAEPWRRWRLRAGAGVARDEAALRLAWERHGSDDVRLAFDRFQVGGVRRSVLPEDADLARVPVPALPAGWLVGDEHEAQRVELALEALPAPLFFERHRVWSATGDKGEWLSLAGLEVDFALPPSPILALPAARVTAGAAYVLDDPAGDLADEVRLWAALVWRP